MSAIDRSVERGRVHCTVLYEGDRSAQDVDGHRAVDRRYWQPATAAIAVRTNCSSLPVAFDRTAHHVVRDEGTNSCKYASEPSTVGLVVENDEMPVVGDEGWLFTFPAADVVVACDEPLQPAITSPTAKSEQAQPMTAR